jgi:arginyl-tRNA synthetase
VLRQLAERGLVHDAARGRAELARLALPHERRLMVALTRLPEVVDFAAATRAPHALVNYLRELATEFHGAYAAGNEQPAQRIIVEDAELRDARLTLVLAARQVIRNGLAILGVSAPEAM